MEKPATIIFGAIVIGLFAPLIGILLGCYAGWIVGLVFEQTIFDVLARLGVNVDGLKMWQIGAVAGFFGSFLRTRVMSQKD